MKISYKVGMLFLLLFCSWEIHADWSQVINGYQWWYTVINGSAEIQRYVNIVYSAYSTMPNPSGEITVPSRIGGYEVTSIGDNTFEKEWNITGVTIPNSVKHIGYRAFYYCSGMKRVDFGNGVTNVGNDAFYNCTGLTSVTIPSNVKSIDPYAFQGCSGLNNLTILNGVTNIGACAFNRCISLPSLIIPGSIRRIGNYAFSDCSGLMNLTIGYGVTSIGDNAFEKCSGLKGTLQIPSSVKSIGNATFKGCSGLSGRLAIPIGVTSIGSAAFNGCSGLTGILTIPNGMASIAEFTFEGCSGLEEVKLGVNVSSIGSYAFSECTSVSNFSFSGPPPSVGSYAFRNVKSGACGYYPTEYRAEWEAVIDINGYWKGLKMKEYTPPKLTLTAESADWWSGSITLRCTDGDKSGTAYLSLMYYDTAKGQWSEIERDELEIPLPVIETNEDGGEVLVTRITDKKFARRNNGLGILRYRVTDESERIAECATRDRHGLFVSVDDYANTNIIDLDGYASQEARVFKRAYETYGGATGFIYELTDGLSTKNGILTKLDGMVEKVKAGDIFLFYFAGHGGRGYVECNDSDKNVRTTVGKITAEDLRTQLEKFKQGVGIVAIINSCYSESMFIQQDDDDDNIGWIMAAREDQTAGGGRFGKIVCDEGWFKGMADGLGEYGQGNNNGYVTFWELAEYGFGWTIANPYYIDNYGIRRTQQINFKTGLVLGNIVAGRVPPQDRANRMLSWSMWFSSVFEFSGGDIAAVEGRTAANGCRTVGECYALGINPEDPNDDFRITAFRKEDGQPVITVNHTTDGSGNSFADRIRTLGKKSLTDAEWVDITDMDQSEYRFFKVSVELDDGGSNGGGSDNGEDVNLDDFEIEQGVLQRYVGDAVDVVIPSSVTSIGNYLFAGNTNIVSVTIPGGVTNIGNYAFTYCSCLTNMTFAGNAPSVGRNAFQGDFACTVYVSRGSSGWGVAIPGTWNGMQIEYFDSTPEDDAPANDDRANAITLSGASGTRSFSTDGATVENGEPITLSCASASSSVWFTWTAPINGEATFSTEGSDFDTVLGIYRYDTLTEVAFNDDKLGRTSRCTFAAQEGQVYYVVVAGYGASGTVALSWECVEGEDVNMNDFVIEQGVLQRYVGDAVNVAIPGNVTSIANYGFAGNTNLVSVTILGGVTNIGNYAFAYCSSLTNMTFAGNAPSVGSNAFQGDSACTVYVKRGSSGWGVTIPGTWNGMAIRFKDDDE